MPRKPGKGPRHKRTPIRFDRMVRDPDVPHVFQHSVERGKQRLVTDVVASLVQENPSMTPSKLARTMGISLAAGKELLRRYRASGLSNLDRARAIFSRPGQKSVRGVAKELGLSIPETIALMEQLIQEAKKKEEMRGRDGLI